MTDAVRKRTPGTERARELAKARKRKERALERAGLKEFTLALPWVVTLTALIERRMSEAEALHRELVERELAEIVREWIERRWGK